MDRRRFPKAYLATARLMGIVNPKDLDPLDAHITGKSVIDIGCGPRPVLYSPSAPRLLVGIDLSEDFVRYPQGATNGVGFRMRCDARSLPFEDRSFEIGLFVFSLHHIAADFAAPLKEAARCCSEELVIVDHVQDEAGIRRAIKSVWWKWKDHGLHYNTRAEWKALLQPYRVVKEIITGRPLWNIYQAVIDLRG